MIKVCVFLCPRERPVFGSTTTLHMTMGHAKQQGIEVEPLLMDEENTFGFHNLDIGMVDFLKTDCTHIFIGADDIQFPVDCIAKLILRDKDIICGIYPKRDPASVTIANFIPPGRDVNQMIIDGVLERSDFAAGHTLTIKRHVIEKMIEKYPELTYKVGEDVRHSLFLPFIRDGELYMDDFAFSMRAREAGFEIWQDFSVNCAHRASGWVRMQPQRRE